MVFVFLVMRVRFRLSLGAAMARKYWRREVDTLLVLWRKEAAELRDEERNHAAYILERCIRDMERVAFVVGRARMVAPVRKAVSDEPF